MNASARAAPAQQRRRTPGTRFRDCPECPEMVVAPAGRFMMGSPWWEVFRWPCEGPVHEVAMAHPFAVGVYEVTFGEWDACVSGGGCGGYRPDDRHWGRGRRPVVRVSWEDAKGYVEWLSRKTGEKYRLLSESEWEYVVRAGTTGPFHTGATMSRKQVARLAVFRRGTQVGELPANRFGLYDVHGNVSEWVEDCWNRSYAGAPTDGSAWESGDCYRRVVRGGSWQDWSSEDLRSASRDYLLTGYRYDDDVGFRVARTLTP